MSTDVIREFLVSLSWKEDEAGRRRFLDGIESATKTVLALGVALEAAAVATVGVVHRIASNFESLHYASSRVGASATNIRAFAYAVSQLGGTTDAALGSLEAFSRKLRESPGQEAWLKSWGVQTRDAQGRLRDSTQLMQELVKSNKFQSQPEWLKLRLAENAGIDERTYRAMLQGLDKFTAEFKQKLRDAGIDPDAAARNAVKFEQAWRSMFMSLQVVMERVGTLLMEKLQEPFEKLIKLLNQHGPEIAAVVAKMAAGIMDAAVWIANLTERFINFISQYDPIVKKLTGIESAFGAIAAVLFLRMIPGLSSVTTLLTALVGGAAWNSLMAVLRLLGMGGSAAAMGVAGAGAGIGALAGGALGMMPGSAGQGEDEFARQDALRKNPQQREQKKDRGFWGRIKKWLGVGADARETVEGQQSGPPGKYRPGYKLSDADLSDAVINTIAGEAHTNSQTSVDAVINNMLNRVGTDAYGPSKNLRDVARAPGQYAGYRRASQQEADFIKQRIQAIASGGVPDNTNGSNEYRAGWYMGPWGRKHANAPVIGGNRFAYNPAGGRGPFGPYDKPRELTSPAPIGHSAITNHSFASHLINQKNTYNITEAGSAGATAKAIGGMQSRSNSELIRNLQGAAR